MPKETDRTPSAATTDEQRLREMLASVYAPEQVEIWLAYAYGWSMERKMQLAEQLVTGAVV